MKKRYMPSAQRAFIPRPYVLSGRVKRGKVPEPQPPEKDSQKKKHIRQGGAT